MHSDNDLNKKTVARNTIMLYIRLFFLMIVGFVTTRVVLNSLGESDFGLNNAIAGFVALFSVLTNSLNAAISRFLTYELGKENQERLNRIFSTSVFIQFIMSLIVAVLLETLGIWFMTNYMMIPAERLFASRWVLHFAVIQTFITLTFVPYSASIISHERMSIYAYVSIIEGILHLVIAYLIKLDVWNDKLIYYSAAICASNLIVNLIYRLYCTKNFQECKIKCVFDKDLLKAIGGFAGWNMFGACSAVLRDQGINVLFNMFFGPSVNAARGISNQASGLATKFSTGFMQALNPQLTKSYASGNHDYMYSLLFQGTRMSFALFFVIALPIFIEANFLMNLWLVEVPVHTIAFIRIALLLILLDSINAGPLITIQLATGNIKKYQIVVGGLQFIDFPLAYVLLKIGMSPEIVMIMVVIIAFLCMMARLYMLKGMVDFPIKTYFENVVQVELKVILFASILPVVLYFLLPDSLLCHLLVCGVSVLSAAIFVWFIDITKTEREKILNVLYNRVPVLKKYIK